MLDIGARASGIRSTELHESMRLAPDEASHRVHAMLQELFNRSPHHFEDTVEIAIGSSHTLPLHSKQQLFAVKKCLSQAFVVAVGTRKDGGPVLIVELREELLSLFWRIARGA